MAIAGNCYTQLQTCGVPGRRFGPFRPSWVVPVEFTLKISGSCPGDFEECLPWVQKGDEGIQLIVQVVDSAGVPVDISAALSTVIKLSYPDGSAQDFNATFVSDGVDGKIQYSTEAEDLSQVGLYGIQAKIGMGNAPKSSELGKFEVRGNIDEN